MGNGYYHDAYYGLEGFGETWIGQILLIVFLFEVLSAFWGAIHSDSFFDYLKNNLSSPTKLLLQTLGLMLIIVMGAFAVKYFGYVVLAFLIFCFVNDYYRKKNQKTNSLSIKANQKSSDLVCVGRYCSNAPIDEFLINHLVRFAKGDGYYVYYKHDHHYDELSQGMEWTNYTAYFDYDIVPETGNIAHIMCRAYITNKGSFAYYPQSIKYIYRDGTTKELSCNGFELLYIDSAVVEIFNCSGPHPNCPWPKISGSLKLS